MALDRRVTERAAKDTEAAGSLLPFCYVLRTFNKQLGLCRAGSSLELV